MTDTKKSAKRTNVNDKPSVRFTDDELAAMKDHAQELKAASTRGSADEAEGERDVLAKIAEMPEGDRAMATRIHQLILASAPDLVPRTYYGMPAYSRGGKTICFFRPASKFKERYATLGFQPEANLDQGAIWPNSYALTALTPVVEERIAALVKQAVS